MPSGDMCIHQGLWEWLSHKLLRRLGGGWMGGGWRKNVCVGSRGWKHIFLAFFSFPSRAGRWGGGDPGALEKGNDWRALRMQLSAEDC